MKTLALATALVFLSSLAFAADMTGYISDSKCAMESGKAARATDWIKPKMFESCVKKCVADGAEAIFLTEDNRILKIDAASREKVMQHLGQKVSVSATVTNGTIKIDSISTVPME